MHCNRYRREMATRYYGVREEQSVQSMALKEPNFRFARQPPTIVTWAELGFYDLPLIRPSVFVNSAASGRTNRCRTSLPPPRLACRWYLVLLLVST
jgi:hypothetical protein